MPEVNLSTEVMDLSDLFPEVTPEKETTLFQKHSDTIDIDELDEVKKPVVVPPVVATKPVVVDPKAVVVEPVVVVKPVVVPQGTPTLESLDEITEDFEAAKQGSKAGLIEFFKAKIEAKELTPFSDFDETKQTLDEYLKGFKTKDFDDLLKSNLDQKEADIASALPQQFFESLPNQLQYAAKYVADGGTDLPGLFKALSQVEDIKLLDPVKDAEKICENYLAAKEFGTAEEIQEQIAEWKDLGVLDKKSTTFKPQLDKLQEVIVQKKLEAQEEIKKNQVLQADYYHDNVIEALKTEDLFGIKIDKKTQIGLYKSLTEPSFKDSRGKQCTEFAHQLDNLMWGEKPDYKTLATIQWILKDREGYEKALANKAVSANVEETVRTLKTEQAKNRAAVVESAAPVAKKIVRPGSGLFTRR